MDFFWYVWAGYGFGICSGVVRKELCRTLFWLDQCATTSTNTCHDYTFHLAWSSVRLLVGQIKRYKRCTFVAFVGRGWYGGERGGVLILGTGFRLVLFGLEHKSLVHEIPCFICIIPSLNHSLISRSSDICTEYESTS
jgi:hypothetical protein